MHQSASVTGLTDAQRKHLAEEGYFVVEQALSAAEIKRLTRAMDVLFAGQSEGEAKGEKEPGGGQREDRSSTLANAIEKSDELIVLLDHPVIFPLVLDLLGPYINLGLSETTQKRAPVRAPVIKRDSFIPTAVILFLARGLTTTAGRCC